jgi:DNA-directed RNA polymerase subunit RPC12/RpoP
MEITAALASLKSVSDLVKLALELKIDSAVTEKAIESQSAIISIQSVLLALQSEHQALLKEKAELEQLITQANDWKDEFKKYDLEQVEPGIFVYEPKQGPVYWLCSRCFEDRRKSILNRTGNDSKGIIYLCFNCQNSIRVHRNPGEVKTLSAHPRNQCPNCGKSLMNPIPLEFREAELAIAECPKCGYKE